MDSTSVGVTWAQGPIALLGSEDNSLNRKSMKRKTNLLEIENVLDINEAIYKSSLEEKKIEYGGHNDNPIYTERLKALIEKVPDDSILRIAAYYLKNMILMQILADGNHRTSLMAVEFFLDNNGYQFDYTVEDATTFEKDVYRLRFKIYQGYHGHGNEILDEERNELDEFCFNFINEHLAKSN